MISCENHNVLFLGKSFEEADAGGHCSVRALPPSWEGAAPMEVCAFPVICTGMLSHELSGFYRIGVYNPF